ncbi:MAG: hypothetical protein GY716_00430 [bacterium]|nr:hypothetical protein [bacterium]
MTRRHSLTFLTLLLLLGGFAFGEEIVHFSNGTTMAVHSHEVVNGMVRVELGDNAQMAFPQYVVDQIEAAGKTVHLNREFAPGKKRGGTQVLSSRLDSRNKRPERSQTETISNPNLTAGDGVIENDKDSGLAVHKPFARGSHAAKRNFAVAGSQTVLTAPVITDRSKGIVGTRRVGNRNVIGSPIHPRMRSKKGDTIIPFEAAPGKRRNTTRPDPGESQDQ